MNAPEVAPVTRTLTQDMLNAYAEASGDHNPIHTDEAFARTTPMGGTIAHGMLVLSFISEMMTGAFRTAWLTTGTLDVRFRAPARPGDTVTARATPQPSKDEHRLRYAVECVSQHDEVLISGTAEVLATSN
jgi:3-hydroxybutyryl-CoA dehydratase